MNNQFGHFLDCEGRLLHIREDAKDPDRIVLWHRGPNGEDVIVLRLTATEAMRMSLLIRIGLSRG